MRDISNNCRVTYNTGDNPMTLRYEVHFNVRGEWILAGWSDTDSIEGLYDLGKFGIIEDTRVIDTHETKPIGGEE